MTLQFLCTSLLPLRRSEKNSAPILQRRASRALILSSFVVIVAIAMISCATSTAPPGADIDESLPDAGRATADARVPSLCGSVDGACPDQCFADSDPDCVLTCQQPESDLDFCIRLAKNCGQVTAADNCGYQRSANCNLLGITEGVIDAVPGTTCDIPMTCGAATENVCSCPTEQLTTTGSFSTSRWQWQGSSTFGKSPQLVSDLHGGLHLVYTTGASLIYAYRAPVLVPQDMLWTKEIVFTDDLSDSIRFPSLAVSPSGTIHIALRHKYSENGSKITHLTRGDDEVWRSSTVDPAGQGGATKVVLDSDQRAHIVYHESTDLKYARRLADGTWQLEVVDNLGLTGVYIDAVMDEMDSLHIAFYAGAPYRDLKYAQRSAAGSWELRTIDAAGDTGLEPSLALGPQNQLYILYSDISDQSFLKLATFEGQNWTIEIFQLDAFGGELTVDISGALHVLYRRWTAPGFNGFTTYAHRTNTGVWSEYEFNSGLEAPSIAIDLRGQVQFASRESESGRVEVFTGKPCGE